MVQQEEEEENVMRWVSREVLDLKENEDLSTVVETQIEREQEEEEEDTTMEEVQLETSRTQVQCLSKVDFSLVLVYPTSSLLPSWLVVSSWVDCRSESRRMRLGGFSVKKRKSKRGF